MDASLEGWGAHIESLMASGFWPLELKSQHINVLEMKAVWLALQAFAPHIQGHSVLLVTDSTTVSAYINRRGVTLVHIVQSSDRDYIMVCQEQNTHQSETLARKTQCFGRLSVQEREHCSDRMVTESASDKPDISHLGYPSSGSICYSPEQEITAVFVSSVPDLEAYAIDALNSSWMGMWAYAFPPFPLILSCLRKIHNKECIVCLIAPLWEGQAWFPLLMSLVIAPPLRLPAKKDLLCQPVSRMLHPTP